MVRGRGGTGDIEVLVIWFPRTRGRERQPLIVVKVVFGGVSNMKKWNRTMKIYWD